jgi:beta-lactamase class A
MGWKEAIETVAIETPFETGLYVKRLGTGEMFAHNETRRFPSASLIKLFILHHLFTERSELLMDAVRFGKAQAAAGGILHVISDGASFRLEDLAAFMLSVSDNTAANILIDVLGMDGINASARRAGARGTELRRKMMDFTSSRAGRENYTTASDIALVLAEILKNRRMVELLSVQKSSSGLPALLPFDDMDDVEAVLAHKTGGLPGITHDAGVFFYSSDPVVAVALTSGAASGREGCAFCASIGKIIYDAFLPEQISPKMEGNKS